MGWLRHYLFIGLLGAQVLLCPVYVFASEAESPPGPQILVDRVLAAVGDTPITASQVVFETELRAQITSSPQGNVFGRLLTETVDPLEALIFREILRRRAEARTLPVDEALARNRLRLFENSFLAPSASASFQARWGVGRSDLLEFFKESVVLDGVVSASVIVQVSEEEKRTYYDRNRDRVFGDKPYEDVADFVAQQVHLLKFEAEYNSWRSRLRAKTAKRYIGR
jgi:hypothetical protein